MATANKNLSEYNKEQLMSAADLRIGIVVSDWNNQVTDNLFNGAKDVFLDCGASTKNIQRFNVPGSFELIFGAKKLLQTQKYDVVIVIGCVIEGETKHFDFVCDGVTQGIQSLNVQYDVPTIFCVLTDKTMEQSIARSGGGHGNKGVEAAVTALKMIAFNQSFNK